MTSVLLITANPAIGRPVWVTCSLSEIPIKSRKFLKQLYIKRGHYAADIISQWQTQMRSRKDIHTGGVSQTTSAQCARAGTGRAFGGARAWSDRRTTAHLPTQLIWTHNCNVDCLGNHFGMEWFILIKTEFFFLEQCFPISGTYTYPQVKLRKVASRGKVRAAISK